MECGSTNTPDACIYDRQDTFKLDKEFILTQGKTLTIGLPYLLLEGNKTKAVRLVAVQEVDDIINLKVEELDSLKTFNLSWNLDYNGQYWLWSLADFPTLSNLPK